MFYRSNSFRNSSIKFVFPWICPLRIGSRFKRLIDAKIDLLILYTKRIFCDTLLTKHVLIKAIPIFFTLGDFFKWFLICHVLLGNSKSSSTSKIISLKDMWFIESRNVAKLAYIAENLFHLQIPILIQYINI